MIPSPLPFEKEEDYYYMAGVYYGTNDGKIEGKKEVAIEMKKQGLDLQLISELTKLPLEEIQTL
jgi:hypothetical protein